jgi:AraC-like DNA-binding protein
MNDLTAEFSSDVLSAVLQSVRFRGAVMCKSTLRSPWGFAVEGREFASFHHVVRGSGWLDVEGISGQWPLVEGDLVILPHGNPHIVRDSPATPATRLDQLIAQSHLDGLGNLEAGGRGPETVLVCGGFHTEHRTSNPLMAALPPVLHLQGKQGGWLSTVLAFLAEESGSGAPGADAMIARLADVAFIQAVRSYFSSAEAHRAGMAVALEDPRIGAVLSAIHRRPEGPWTLGSLAKIAGMSRTAFASRFRALMGQAPLQYVADRRMEKARQLLRETTATIPEIAEWVGYESPVAFQRAFKRHTEVAPAAFRRSAKTGRAGA